jgi:hypothetical protein
MCISKREKQVHMECFVFVYLNMSCLQRTCKKNNVAINMPLHNVRFKKLKTIKTIHTHTKSLGLKKSMQMFFKIYILKGFF